MQRTITSSIRAFAKPWAIIAIFASCMLSIANAETSFNGATFDDWTVKCTPSQERVGGLSQELGKRQNLVECSLSQRIEFEDSREPLLKVDLYLNPKNSNSEAIFVLPLGIPLNTAPILSFDNARNVSLSVSHCHSDGCYFKLPLKGDLLESFLSMQSAQLTLIGGRDETLKIPISGKGSRLAHNYFKSLATD